MPAELHEFTVREQDVGGEVANVVRRRATGSDYAFRQKRLMILVHGFNMSYDYAAASLAEFLRLLSGCLSSSTQPLPTAWAFYWPGDHVDRWLSAANYAASVPRSKLAGERLGKLLTRLEPDQQVTLIGHSLGCRVVLEAMRYVADAREDGTASAQVVGIHLMAAAVPVLRCTGFGAPYRSAVIRTPIHVLHSRNDGVLHCIFPAGQFMSGESKGEAVGRNGGPPRRWLELHDTGLGHGDYLTDVTSAAEVARIIDPALPRHFRPRPLPKEHCLKALRPRTRKLPSRPIGSADAPWLNCWPVAGSEHPG